mmetsp:Transcript_13216/g.20615  ORF Transcript_13216/g.20615 Transcript_13216/m.20615 type:complete len:146 (-) Transcript_13216:82-519(-)
MENIPMQPKNDSEEEIEDLNIRISDLQVESGQHEAFAMDQLKKPFDRFSKNTILSRTTQAESDATRFTKMQAGMSDGDVFRDTKVGHPSLAGRTSIIPFQMAQDMTRQTSIQIVGSKLIRSEKKTKMSAFGVPPSIRRSTLMSFR